METAVLTSGIAYVLGVLAFAVNIYSFVLFVRVLLSWFPNVDLSNPILSGVVSISDPYLNMFRGVIPPLGGFDLSAILAFVALNLLRSLLLQSSAIQWTVSRSLNQRISCSRGSSSSSSCARDRTGAVNPRALGLRTSKGPGVPAGMANRRANVCTPGFTSPMDPTRVRF